MKTTIVYFALALIFSATTIQVQEIKDGFKIEKSEINGKPAIGYTDIDYKDTLKSPKDSTRKTIEIIGMEFISRETLDSIEKVIFTPKEIKLVNDYRCIAFFSVSSTGKIEYVSFKFILNNPRIKRIEPKVDTKKLALYSIKIKECTKFKLYLDGDVKEPCHLRLSIPVFVSLRIK